MNTKLQEFYTHQKKLHILGGVSALLGRDHEANLPKDAGETRAEQSSFMSGIQHQYSTEQSYLDLIDKLAGADQSTWSAKDKRSVYLAKRASDKSRLLSQEFVEHFEKTKTQAQHTRAQARKENDFQKFLPHLEAIISLSKEYASLVKPGNDIYDTLLDEYEEGMDQKAYDSLLLPIKETLINIVNSHKTDRADMAYKVSVFDKVNTMNLLKKVVTDIGFNLDKGLIGEVHHPFQTTLGPNDIRINTRFDDLIETIYSTIHEAGHGLYEQHSSPEYDRTNLAGGRSLGIHESQSRLVENIIGRSHEFATYLYPLLQKFLPKETAGFTRDGLHAYLTTVKPGNIRVQADEVSYNLHILLRYEIEKGLINGSFQAKDLPEIRNGKMEEYLGIRPKNDALGCLQDVHRSFGLIGYFPTYMLGNIISAQLWYYFQKDHPDRSEKFSSGDFGQYTSHFKEKIRQHGAMYPVHEFVQQATGEALTSTYFTTYLQERY